MDHYDTPNRKGVHDVKARTFLKRLKSRKYAITKSLIHVPSVAITLGVLPLTFRQIFWEPPAARTNAILNSLQFAAQVHASLIVMSLSAILLHMAHHGLSAKRGVPLGFISSTFQLSSISYLFGTEFTSLNIGYIITFLSLFALAILSGPSSAITMMPRLQFWSTDNLWLDQGSMEFHVYIEANETTLYPEILMAENAPPQCLGPNSSILSECPSFGMRHWMLDDEIFVIGQSRSGPINKSIEETWVRYMVGASPDVNTGIQSVYIMSTLPNFIGRALFAYKSLLENFIPATVGVQGPNTIQSRDRNVLARYDLSFLAAGQEIATRKPVVEVECASYIPNSSLLGLPHDKMAWPPWRSEPIASAEWNALLSDYSSLAVDPNSTLVNSSWIDFEQFGSVKPSLAAFFATPEIIFASGCFDTCLNYNFSLHICTIDARWMPTKAFSDASSGKAAIYDSNPDPEGPILATLSENSSVTEALPSVFISKSWTKLLNVPWIDSIAFPSPSNRTILDTIGQKCLNKNTFINATIYGIPFDNNLPRRVTDNPMKMLECLQNSLSIFIADAVARMQDSIPTYFVAEGHHLVTYDEDSSSDVFLVQDLYRGELVQHDLLYGRIMNMTKEDFADSNRFTEIRMSTSRWGYGYEFQSSKLIYFGTAVLLLHVALCVIHMTWMLGLGEGWRTGLASYAVQVSE